DSFVNSPEWPLPHGRVPDLHLGIVGALPSSKSTLVHHYLTGSYIQEGSPDRGRFGKEIIFDNQSFLLHWRDERGLPELQEVTLHSKNIGSSAEQEAMSRTDYLRDDDLKMVSTPGIITATPSMPPSTPPNSITTPAKTNIMDAMPPPQKVLITQSFTPKNKRKSIRKSNLFTPSKKNFEKDKSKNSELGSGRAIPIKQGYLYKKSSKTLNKEWKKKYVTLCDNGRLTYHSSLHDYMEDSHGKDICLQYTTVKVPGMNPRGSKVIPENVGNGCEHISGDMHGPTLANQSSTTISLTGRVSLGEPIISLKDRVPIKSYEPLRVDSGVNDHNSGNNISKIEASNIKKRRRRKSSGHKSAECEDSDGHEFSIVSLDNTHWHFEASNQDERDEWITAIEQQTLSSLQGNQSNKSKDKQVNLISTQVITAIKTQVPGNLHCIDCDTSNPEWASINLGILMCIECSGIHRNLGSHISKVRSLDLDEWLPGPLSVMMALGNETGNSIWEAHPSQGKPNPHSSREDKEHWIRTKYEKKAFILLPQPEISLHKQIVESVACDDVQRLASLLPHAGDIVNAPLAPPRDLQTPLHLAVALPSLPCTQLLLWYSADVKVCDAEGKSSLFYARMSGNKDVIDLLLQAGCPDSIPIPSHTPGLPQLGILNTSSQQNTASELPQSKLQDRLI
ncbi:unnamed protein product, partial [Meganyctiphanes norvegica]